MRPSGRAWRGRGWACAAIALAAGAALALEDSFDPVGALPSPPAATDGTFGRVVNNTPYPTAVTSVNGLAYDPGSNTLWVTDPRSNLLHEIDRAGKQLRASYPLPDGSAADAAWDGSAVWYSDLTRNEIYRLDPATGAPLTSFTPPGPAGFTEGLTWDGSSLWMSNAGDGNLYRTDTAGTVQQACKAPASSGGADGLAYDAVNGLLLMVGYDRGLYRLDPVSCAVLQGPVPIAGPNNGLAFDGFLAWDGQNDVDVLREYDVDTPTDSAGIPLPIVSEEARGSITDARQGSSVAAAGDLDGGGLDQTFHDFIAGAPGYSDPAAGVPVEAGAALVYLGADNTTDRVTPDLVFTGEAAHDRAGVAVAGDFDFNGDGIPDLLIGAEQVDRSAAVPRPTGAGKVYLIYFDPGDVAHYPHLGDPAIADTVSLGRVGQPGGIPGVVFTGVTTGDQTGFAVAGGGRVNPGPGQDLAIGAPGADTAQGVDSGVVYVIFDDPGLSGTIDLEDVAGSVPGVVYEGAAAGDGLGFSVAFPGDVVEPGGDDLAMGAPFADPDLGGLDAPLADAGATYVPSGGDLQSGIIETCDIGGGVAGAQILGDQAGMQSGYSVAGGGDNLQNGEADLLIGAPLFDVATAADQTLSDVGAVFQSSGALAAGIIETCDIGGGGVVGTDRTPVDGVQYHGDVPDGRLGTAVSGVGDATASGGDDVALGAPGTDPGGLIDAGTVYVVQETTGSAGFAQGGSFSGIIETCDIGGGTAGRQLNGVQPGEASGSSLAGTGDLSGDADTDFVAGSPGKDQTGQTDAGAVWLVLESHTLATFSDNPPVADASATVTPAECDGNLAATVLLDGSFSTDPDSAPGTNDDIVLFEWFEGQSSLATGEIAPVSLGLGVHDVTLRVTDSFGADDTDLVSITVRDSQGPLGGVTGPSAGVCRGPTELPVLVTDDFDDVCDPSFTRGYDPPPGPSYDTHGDYTVTVSATDGAGNLSTDSVSFTIDTVPPAVTILFPPSGTLDIGADLPIDVIFDATDDDGAAGAVVHETMFLDDCLVYDGFAYGDGDGLLQDETISLSETELCRVLAHCGFSSLVMPVLRVEATDCGGNLASASVEFVGDLAIDPGVCVPISTRIEDPVATVADWDEHANVDHYDVVRGNLASLRVVISGREPVVDLGTVSCIESRSADTTTAGHEDQAMPAPGQVFFYVIRSFDGQVETRYGRASNRLERVVQAGEGDCH